ncbi:MULTISPECIES: hypothetical protein [unclassified Pseudomonas]|uniref:hypothetical protein n=1 Tax=unclassified Pseudomonas TaxID=196821 RepID=UPI002448AE3C|nr:MULTISPECIES: hypothetical protein [unclassified Pseudomonas]MDG9928274.1 hypothetical protein [Pseudomonas sp. GD04042]MDH0481162.1 hypothetical protein [Pseudomonas sp. GD04015]MDH0604498.1 hypothetical protein [Pseudomonas sp. GD03869]
MALEQRIRRWCREAERRGRKLERILIHPDDLAEAITLYPWLPIKVLGQDTNTEAQP